MRFTAGGIGRRARRPTQTLDEVTTINTPKPPTESIAVISEPNPGDHLVLTIVCPDRPGIVHAVTGAIAGAGGNITELQQFASIDTGRFFMRVQIDMSGSDLSFEETLAPVADEFGMEWEVDVVGRPIRTLILATTAEHCVQDLLFRHRAGLLPIEIVSVLANHDTLRDLVSFYEVPFEHRPIASQADKAAFENRIREIIADNAVELVVLARYMQILSPELCRELEGRAINIHHSFLPGFKGANPYLQAHRRGVKLIGATAHFVTENLDEGPIIEQNVTRVDHGDSATALRVIGRDIESRTLRQAVGWFAEHRILLDEARTIIFE